MKKHPDYPASKSGDDEAARRLVADTLNEHAVAELRKQVSTRKPILVGIHAYEAMGVNAIPDALASALGKLLSLPIDSAIVQANSVGHTGADGFTRLANQAEFSGEVLPGVEYVLVDDFVGQGGTLANLKGHIERQGGRVLCATTLTGKPHSARLSPSVEQLGALREKHGKELEQWWAARFGHSFDCLTESEARYLAHTEDADTVRNRVAAAEQARDQ